MDRSTKSYSEMTKVIKRTVWNYSEKIKSLGISGMMHGYLVFDRQEDLLVPFRTWRNNNANQAAKILRENHFK